MSTARPLRRDELLLLGLTPPPTRCASGYASGVKRGELWWARLDERRPVLVLTEDDEQVGAVVVVPPAPSPIDGVSVEVTLGEAGGLCASGVVRVALPRPGSIPCHWLVTLHADDFIERVGVLSPHKLREVEDVLHRAGLDRALTRAKTE
jgi:mRNA interferase MazF